MVALQAKAFYLIIHSNVQEGNPIKSSRVNRVDLNDTPEWMFELFRPVWLLNKSESRFELSKFLSTFIYFPKKFAFDIKKIIAKNNPDPCKLEGD